MLTCVDFYLAIAGISIYGRNSDDQSGLISPLGPSERLTRFALERDQKVLDAEERRETFFHFRLT